MYRLRWGMTFWSEFTLCIVAVLVLPVSGCDDGPPPKVAPIGTPVDKEHFSDAKLTFKDEIVKNNHLILESGKEFEYSGSFHLTQLHGDDKKEQKEYIERICSTLRLLFRIDREKSGYGPPKANRPQLRRTREITTASERVSDSRVDASNVIHFAGKMKAPKGVGEHELRLAFLPEGAQERIYILTRLVQVVEPQTPSGS